jgi:hypothetical protein
VNKVDLLGWCVLLVLLVAVFAGPVCWFIGDLLYQRRAVTAEAPDDDHPG